MVFACGECCSAVFSLSWLFFVGAMATAQFDTDYLEKMSSCQTANPSSLSRESLFVKFDPLVSQPASNQRVSPLANM